MKKRLLKFSLAAGLCAAMLPPLTMAPVLAQEPRVVSVGGALTEIVYALGMEQKLVAVDTTSIYPAAALKLPKVGYMRALSSEGVLSMKPSLVLATNEAGPAQVMSQLKSAGVRMEVVNADHTFEELRNKVKVISAALGVPAEGKKLDESLLSEWQAAQQAAQAAGSRKLRAGKGCRRIVKPQGRADRCAPLQRGAVACKPGAHRTDHRPVPVLCNQCDAARLA